MNAEAETKTESGDYQSFMDDESIDGQIRQLKIELAAFKRKEKKAYQAALSHHNKMTSRKIELSDKNIMLHDRALLIIRSYRRKYYLDWIEHENKRGAGEDMGL